jgi:hypothetical protein
LTLPGGNIPTFIHIADFKYHDVNALVVIEIILNSIYVIDKAYVDFRRLYILNEADAYCLVAYLDYQLRNPHSVYEMMQTSGISAFVQIHIDKLLTKSQIEQNVKEQLNYLISMKYWRITIVIDIRINYCSFNMI